MKSIHCLASVAAAAVVVALGSGPVQAQGWRPVVAFSYPAGSAGQSAQITCMGPNDFTGAYRVLVQGTGVTGEVVSTTPPSDGKPNPKAINSDQRGTPPIPSTLDHARARRRRTQRRACASSASPRRAGSATPPGWWWAMRLRSWRRSRTTTAPRRSRSARRAR